MVPTLSYASGRICVTNAKTLLVYSHGLENEAYLVDGFAMDPAVAVESKGGVLGLTCYSSFAYRGRNHEYSKRILLFKRTDSLDVLSKK